MKTSITFTSQNLSSRFQSSDKANEKHRHNLIYYSKCPEPSCTKDYRCDTSRRITEQTNYHAGKEKKLHLLKHSLRLNYRHVDLSNMKIIDSSFHNNKLKKKIFEALYIKQYQVSLNSQ